MNRRRAVVVAGHQGDQAASAAGWRDPDPGVRTVALGALRRSGALSDDILAAAFADPAAVVRRRACEEVLALGSSRPRAALGWLVDGLTDGDATVVEAACFVLGEVLTELTTDHAAAIDGLGRITTDHADPLCREAAVAALGAIGDEGALAYILAATQDKAAVRRRAVLALAPFEGPDVDAALARALEDRDWQVRQAAEDLTAT